MELIKQLIDFILHIDTHMAEIISKYGVWTYGILFLIIFCETAFVVTPFLPGDSLLFACGTFAARGALDPTVLIVLLSVAAIAGDTVNYWIGAFIGPRAFTKEDSLFFKKKYLIQTHEFYEKYGGKTIIIARFMPIVRTFAPFVAGIGKMTYTKFLAYNIIGGIAWIMSFVLLGYFFGNIPVVKRNFSLVIIAIIILSILPSIIEVIRHRRRKKVV
ncbi:MAG TPA: DedA family protein [Acidobacteriota bacterium]|nr:DedA family protein [Acidobacteriota bacterium]